MFTVHALEATDGRFGILVLSSLIESSTHLFAGASFWLMPDGRKCVCSHPTSTDNAPLQLEMVTEMTAATVTLTTEVDRDVLYAAIEAIFTHMLAADEDPAVYATRLLECLDNVLELVVETSPN